MTGGLTWSVASVSILKEGGMSIVDYLFFLAPYERVPNKGLSNKRRERDIRPVV